MKLLIHKNFFYQLLFVLSIAIPYLNNFELTISTWTVCLILCTNRKYSYSLLAVTAPFFLILVIAFFSMLSNDYKNYYIIRDVTYLMKPIIGFFIGYQVFKKRIGNPFDLVINTGFLISVIHLLVLLNAIVFKHAATVNDLRFFGGYFSDYEIYVLIILVFHKKFELNYSTKKFWILTGIIGLSAFMYLARTNFLQFIILFLAIKGFLKINRTSIMIISSIVLVGAIGYSAILYINPRRNGPGIEAMLYKLKVAPLEPFKTKINRYDWKDFNDNYRSYENIMTIRQVSHEGWRDIILGKGLGSTIDLKQEVYLGDMQMRYISILHNGFMIVFLKSGLLGIFIYLFHIYYFWRKKASEVALVKHLNLLFIGTGVFLIISNWVFLGFYNLIDTKTVLIGFLIAYREKLTQQI